ncbi:pancreatic lipase-related protein 2-like [Haemaphysalis longicornis]
MLLVSLAVISTLFAHNAEAEVMCYGELGCMEMGGAFYDPVHRKVNNVPNKREEVDTEFQLYSRDGQPDGTKLRWNSTLDDVRRSAFSGSRPTKFLIHGYLDTVAFGAWLADMKNAYLRTADVNVVLVIWERGNQGSYEQAVANTRIVGAEIALFIRKLKEASGADPRTMHVIGHSLGAHVAGYAGANTTNLGRITALDPAEPYFEKMPAEVRVDRTDAEFVDVIHTDTHPAFSKLWLSEGLGMEEAVGHVDFYPNGGEYMPGCDTANRFFKFFTHGLIQGMRAIVSCNHQRAVQYMLDSIENEHCQPLAFECPSYDAYLRGQCADCGPDGSRCAVMGEHAVQWSRFKGNESRRMYTITNAHRPFCAHQYLVTVTTGKRQKRGNAEGFLYLRDASLKKQVNINKRSMEFKPEKNYTFLVKTATARLNRSNEVQFEYRSSQIFSVVGFPLVRVSVRPMSDTVEPSFHLCPPSGTTEISSNKPIVIKDC